MARRLLPWDYGVRNLFRRPSRSALTLGGLSIVVLLVLVVVGFIRGLEASLAATGNPNDVLVYSMSSGADIENSAIPARTPALLSASVGGVRQRHDVKYVSPELYLGTRIEARGQQRGLGLVRGVTTSAPLVRQQVQIVEGTWPGPGEVLVGRLAHSKLGCDKESLAIGQQVEFDGHTWTDQRHLCRRRRGVRIGGVVSVGGSTDGAQTAGLEPGGGGDGVAATRPPTSICFADERIDLELKAVSETAYYADLQKHYKPVRMLGWVVVCLVAGSGVFAGLNTMYGAVVGRIRELATLQAVGFRRRAILLTLDPGSDAAVVLRGPRGMPVGTAVRQRHGGAVHDGRLRAARGQCRHFDRVLTAAVLGVVGAIPPATKAMRLPVVEAIKAI